MPLDSSGAMPEQYCKMITFEGDEDNKGTQIYMLNVYIISIKLLN